MRKFYSLIGLIIFVTQLQAKQIDINTAISVGKSFISSQLSTQNSQNISSLNPVYKAKSTSNGTLTTVQETTYYYVFNNGNNGFIIVSGDDNASPILGYSNEGIFDPNNVPQDVTKWLESYKNQIRFIVENNIPATDDITEQWTALRNGTYQSPQKIKGNIATSVSPLIQTKWNQSPYVNSLCPFDETYNKNAVTGCPATAMAQIMKYWKYPKKGFGFHSYNENNYGTLSANFGATEYKWDDMPDVVLGPNDAVATLMYHCGVAVEMDYGVNASGSYVIKSFFNTQNTVEYALPTYFGYATTLKGLQRADYTDNQWISILKKELDEQRPIQYAGYGQGGHTFVCDGYDANDFFHMNWGWGGHYDGYFNLNALNPGTGGIGAGAGTYNSNQQALIGIKPPDANQIYNLEIYEDVVSSKSTISFGEGFTITTDILNDGTTAFSGDFCAAAFDYTGAFIDFVEIKTGKNLGANYHYSGGITFTTTGLIKLLPGSYTIYIFYRPTNGNWTSIKADAWSIFTDDYTTITVTNPNKFQLYAPMSLTPKTNVYKGQSFSVWLDVANYSTEQFNGTIQVGLYDLDGYLVETIEEKGGLTLNTNTHYSSGLTFKTNNLSVEPGTYYVGVMHKKDGSKWELTGSTTTNMNPIKVIVKAAPLQSDIYELNDTQTTAYNLNLAYIGDSAQITTEGSNFHIGTDLDYYKVILPAGYNYSISAKLHDSSNSENGKTYTADGTFSYSIGSQNSDSYDYKMSNDIVLKGGGTIIFAVSPYFTSSTGTYLLDLNIKRTSSTDVIITQVYGGGGNSGAVYKSDFVEFYNSSSIDVDISGWTLYYLGATATTTNVKYEFPTNTNIKAGKYFALKCADGTGTQPAWNINFDGTSTLALGGTAGKIILMKSNAAFTLSTTPTIDEIINNANFVDYVPYGTTAIPVWGSAMSSNTTSTLAAKRKFVNGKYQYTKNIGNDFELGTAEPHNSTMTVDVKAIINVDIKVFAFNKTLFISGNSIDDSIEIYNITGSMVYNSKFISNTISLSDLYSGIYIVKIGLSKFKIQL